MKEAVWKVKHRDKHPTEQEDDPPKTQDRRSEQALIIATRTVPEQAPGDQGTKTSSRHYSYENPKIARRYVGTKQAETDSVNTDSNKDDPEYSHDQARDDLKHTGCRRVVLMLRKAHGFHVPPNY
jgi:hypothetical protein